MPLMSDEYQILATPVFKITLKKLNAFVTRKYSDKVAKSTKRIIKNKIQNILSSNPYTAPKSERLLALGITNYRQLIIDQHNIVFYRIDEQQKKVLLLAVMDSRQDLNKLLFETNIDY